MAEKSLKAAPATGKWAGRIFTWLIGILCFGGLLLLLMQVGIRFTTPVPLHRLQLVGDVELPTIIVPPTGQKLALRSVRSDRFDFQVFDAQRGLLFISHPGPSAAKTALSLDLLPSGTSFKTSIVVYDTRRNAVVGTIDVPFVHGLALAPDLHKLYAADADDSKIYVIDEQTLQVTKQITASQTPDGLEYDPDLQEVFVSEPGSATPVRGVEEVIDATTDQTIPNQLVKLNADVGHVRYDAVSHHFFVTVVTDKGGELDAIDPITSAVSAHIPLPADCNTAHGLVLDEQQQAAFVGCIGSQNIQMVDLKTMKAVGPLQSVGVKPDILALNRKLHVLFVASNTAVSVFDESKASQGALQKLGDYILSSGTTHTIAVDDTTDNIYLPLIEAGGRPILRIEHYDPAGI